MVEVIAGGLVGALLALLGTYLIVRDTRRGRETASEEKAAASLLTQLRRVRVDPTFLNAEGARDDFTEECLTAVLAFRDAKVRQRLTASVDMITNARRVASIHGEGWLDSQVYTTAFRDVRRCLEARLDRKRLPRPEKDWSAARDNLMSFMSALVAEYNAAEEAWDQERDEDLNREIDRFHAIDRAEEHGP
ncbi:hypothetical protein [Streptomyces olivaceus]|uniref:hypothetical protein n=1 Tax=Streptomyces olivaceus TaxID=47716 RepID=UPI00363FF45E